MEYTKDMIFQIKYGQELEKSEKTFKFFKRTAKIISKHKMITVIVAITIMLMFLDFMLISSFIEVLSRV